MTRVVIVIAAGLALVATLPAVPAHALRARVFVSKAGADVGACSFSAPCQSLDYALSGVEPGGEITILDSGGYNPINITKGVTITVPPGVEAGITAAAGADAIDIAAGPSDAIVLRGLTLNGNGVAYNGIVFNSGGSLTVANCVVQNFFWTGNNNTGNGILIQPTSGTVKFVVTDTKLWYNAATGIIYSPAGGSPNAIGVIDHVVATNDGTGFDFFTHSTTGGSTIIAVSNSDAGNNVNGFFIEDGPDTITLSMDNVSAVGNITGIQVFGSPTVLLGRSVITINGEGIQNNSSPNKFYTYGDNRINGNSADIGGTTPTLNTPLTLQ